MAKKLRTLKPGWKILYRVGTPDRCRWSGVLGYFPKKAEAMKEAKRVSQGNRKVVVMSDKAYRHIGPPIGWNPDDAHAGTFDSSGWWVRDPK